MNNASNQEAIDNFIKWVSEISDCVNSDYWNGEDVMGIFFNEFNRYKKKSESGQVFTPDRITSFMYRLIDIDQNDRILEMKAPKLIQINYSSAVLPRGYIFGKRVHFAGRFNPGCFCFMELAA